MKEASRAIKSATRSLARNFVQNSSILSKLRYLKSTKTPAIGQFEHLLQEIKIIVYEHLKTSVEEEKTNQDQLALIIAKEQKVGRVNKSSEYFLD